MPQARLEQLEQAPQQSSNAMVLQYRHFVDDFTNQMWPEVQEAVIRMYLFDRPRFVPLAFGLNKLLLYHVAYHSDYMSLLEQKLTAAKMRFKRVSRSGYQSLTIVVDPNSRNYFLD
jgi:hypothetical protein